MLKKKMLEKKANDEKGRKYNDDLNVLAVPLPANGVVPVSKASFHPTTFRDQSHPSYTIHRCRQCAAARLSLIPYTQTQQATSKRCKVDERGESIVYLICHCALESNRPITKHLLQQNGHDDDQNRRKAIVYGARLLVVAAVVDSSSS